MTVSTCDVDAEYHSACKGPPKYQLNPEKRYCVLHYPGEDKLDDFEEAKERKLKQKDYDFGGAIFPEGTSGFREFEFDASATFKEATFVGTINFVGAKFNGKKTDFSGAKFSGEWTTFNTAEFNSAQTYFSEAKFSGEQALFHSAKFSGKRTDFSRAEFSGGWATFHGAEFSSGQTYFSGAKFGSERTDFSGAKISGGRTDFSEAEFSSNLWTMFQKAEFSSAETYFSEAKFIGKWTDFSGAKFSRARTDFSRAKFSSTDTKFSEAEFSSEQTYFSNAECSGRETDFSKAKFSSLITYLLDAKFSSERTTFIGAEFSGGLATFSRAEFSSAETYFSEAKFIGTKTDFSGAKFSKAETYFHKTTFTAEVDFSGATFAEKAVFWGTNNNPVFSSRAWVRFEYSRIEKPEQFTFNTVLLRPGWFVNADVRKIDFTDVKWYGMPSGPEGALDEEIAALEKREVESPHTLLAQACRRLSANAEENREYPLANEFHYWSMDTLRKRDWHFYKDLTLRDLLKWETWSAIVKHLGLITTLYWALSGYGVRAARAFWVMVALAAVFAMLYTISGPAELRVFSASSWHLMAVTICPAPLGLTLYSLLDPPLLHAFTVSLSEE